MSELIKVAVGIEGISPLLMHKPNLESQVAGQIPSPEEEAANAAYLDADGKFVIPSANMRACMHDGAAYKKFGKITARRSLALVTIEPYLFPLQHGEDDPKIDTVSAVIKGNRILRSRPRFDIWSAEFVLGFDPEEFKISLEKVLAGWKAVIEYAGIYCGLMDNRPSSPKKPGPHGRFAVKKYEQIID